MEQPLARKIDLPQMRDPEGRGNLSFIEGMRHVPFPIQRIFYLYDVPGGETRGGHAHRQLEQLIIAVSGSFDVVVHDGKQSQRFFLNRSYTGLYLPPMLWRDLENFSSGSVCLVLASRPYEESDYYRNFEEFVAAARGQ
jgi:dTDP-4-dehydrorhamnose 3,5-epimerase-like enzyme